MTDLSKTTARAEEAHRRVDDLKRDNDKLQKRLKEVEDFTYSIRGFIRVVGWFSLIFGFVAAYLKGKGKE